MTPVGYYIPFGLDYWVSLMFSVNIVGGLDDSSTYFSYGLRPVINLNSILKFTGDGTKNNPYVPSL